MTSSDIRTRPRVLILLARVLNIIVLLCSLIIFLVLSIVILKGEQAISHQLYMRIQLSICIIFLIDFWYLFYLNERKTRYFLRNLLFLIISIPYVNIIDWMNMEVSDTAKILLRAILLVRGGYGLVIMITWFTTSKITNLLFSYIAILLGMTYFGSLAFFSIERNINPGLKDFQDAVWWAFMDVSTVGCAIEPVTSEGRILAVILAIMGMTMFPILTAYLTNKFQQKVRNYSDSQPRNPSGG